MCPFCGSLICIVDSVSLDAEFNLDSRTAELCYHKKIPRFVMLTSLFLFESTYLCKRPAYP